MSLIRWKVEKLGPNHCCDGFSCSRPNLDQFLCRRALHETRQDCGQTYVVVNPTPEPDEVPPRVIGYYTVSANSIARAAMPIDSPMHYEYLPTVHLGRLAVDMNHSQRGLGHHLVMHALYNAYRTSQRIGVCGVNLLAHDEQTKQWYQKPKRGFLATRDDNRFHLFLPMGTIRQMFESTDPGQLKFEYGA